MNEDILKPETSLGKYAIKRLLGRGTFGVTYLAERLNPYLTVAIKEYFPLDFARRQKDGTTVNPRSTGAGGDDFNTGLKKFLEESRVLGQFESPHIVRVVDTFELNGTAYMVMHYEEGGTLDQLLANRSQPLTESEVLSIFIPVLEGLKDIHATWYVHRDIKPNNIYIRSDGSPLLIDFGATRDALAVKRGGMTEYLTPGFAPAEQYDRTQDQGPWTDIYAVGATMYYCVTRITPPDGRERAIGGETMMSAINAAPAFYQPRLLEIIDWMMAPRAADRPQSADTVLSHLRTLREDINSGIVSPSAPTLRRDANRHHSKRDVRPEATGPVVRDPAPETKADATSASENASIDTSQNTSETASFRGRWSRLRARPELLWGAGITGLAAIAAVIALIQFKGASDGDVPDLSSVPHLSRQLEYEYRLDLNARESRRGANGFFTDQGVLVATNKQDREYAMFDGNGYMEADNISVDFKDFTLSVWMKPETVKSEFHSALALHSGERGYPGGGDQSARIRVTRERPEPDATEGNTDRGSGKVAAAGDETGGDAVPYVQALVNMFDGAAPQWVASPVRLKTWTHVVFTRLEDGTLQLYVNGERADPLYKSEVSEEHPAASGDFSFTDGQIRVGASNFYGTDGDGPDGLRNRSRWIGALDDVRIYSRALTETEVKTLFRE